MPYHKEFPLDHDIIYLNHAAVAPWPVRSAEAVKAFAGENIHRGAADYPRWMKVETQLRERLAKLINAPSVNDIALLKNTSEALSFVAYGLEWKAGDNIVISNQEFPSNRIVWESLADKGVQVRQADLQSADSPEDAIFSQIDEDTRLLSISSVQYATGLRMDLNRLGTYCREHEILFCVDAIQSLGAMTFDVQQIRADFVMADGHKWMLGPEGVALFYCRKEIREQLKLHEFGWHMIQDAGNYNKTQWQPTSSARRFECGSPNMLGIHALNASLSLLLEIGIPTVEEMLLDNASLLIDFVARDERLELITSSQAGRYAGIVTFKHRHQDNDQLYHKLNRQGVICALRGGGIRFSPHFYTQKCQLERAMAVAVS